MRVNIFFKLLYNLNINAQILLLQNKILIFHVKILQLIFLHILLKK